MAHRILIVDDNGVLIRSLAFILEEIGYSVVAATTGLDALGHLNSPAEFDLLITDLAMPDMEGLELITLLKKSHPDLPVVALSGSVEGLVLAKQLGLKYAIAKPCKRSEVLETVESALSKKATRLFVRVWPEGKA
jgi:CheY-like chemotaxis protein